MLARLTLAPFLLGLLAVTVGALKCYQCESHTEKGCNPLNPALIEPVECPPDTLSYQATYQYATFMHEVNGVREPQMRVVRSCSKEPATSSFTCVERAGTGPGTKNKYCFCDTDACNPGVRQATAAGSVMAILVLLASCVSVSVLSAKNKGRRERDKWWPGGRRY